jgi:hypothetical protein
MIFSLRFNFLFVIRDLNLFNPIFYQIIRVLECLRRRSRNRGLNSLSRNNTYLAMRISREGIFSYGF